MIRLHIDDDEYFSLAGGAMLSILAVGHVYILLPEEDNFTSCSDVLE